MACERALGMENMHYISSQTSDDLIPHLSMLKVSSPPDKSSTRMEPTKNVKEMESLSQGLIPWSDSNDDTTTGLIGAISNGSELDIKNTESASVQTLTHSVSAPEPYKNFTSVHQQFVGMEESRRPPTAPVVRPDFEPFINMQRHVTHGIPGIPCQAVTTQTHETKPTSLMLSSSSTAPAMIPDITTPDQVSQRKAGIHVTISKAQTNTGQNPGWNISITTPPPEVTRAVFPYPPPVHRIPIDQTTVYHQQPGNSNMSPHFSEIIGHSNVSRPGNFPVNLPENLPMDYHVGGGSSSSCSPSQSSTSSLSQAGTPQHTGIGGIIQGSISVSRSPGTPPQSFVPGNAYTPCVISSPSHLPHVSPTYTSSNISSGASSAVSSSVWMPQAETARTSPNLIEHQPGHSSLPVRSPSQQEIPRYHTEAFIQVTSNPNSNQIMGYIHPGAGLPMQHSNLRTQNDDIIANDSRNITTSQGTVPIYERSRNETIPPNNFNKYLHSIAMTSGTPMTPPYYPYYQYNPPYIQQIVSSMSPVDSNIVTSHNRSRSGSLAGPEDPAYTQALVLHQQARLEKLNCDVAEAYGQMEELSRDVKAMEIASSHRRKNRINPIVTATDLAKLREENRKLNVDVDLLTRQVDWITQGQSLLGVVDRNSQRNFYQDIYKGSSGSIQTSDDLSRSSHSSGSTTPADPASTPVSPRTPPARPPPPVPCHPPAPPYVPRASPDDEEGDNWNCTKCTFSNHPLLEVCEQCELPRVRFGTGLLQH